MGGRHRKGHKTRKARRGGGYGFGPALTVGGLEVVKNSTSTPYSSATGAAIPDPFATNGSSSTIMGGRRRKSRKGKSKKGGKKSRKSRGRKMRGGSSQYNVGAVRAEFTGNTGTPGPFTYGTYASAPSKVGGYGPTAGADGVMKTT